MPPRLNSRSRVKLSCPGHMIPLSSSFSARSPSAQKVNKSYSGAFFGIPGNRGYLDGVWRHFRTVTMHFSLSRRSLSGWDAAAVHSGGHAGVTDSRRPPRICRALAARRISEWEGSSDFWAKKYPSMVTKGRQSSARTGISATERATTRSKDSRRAGC